MRESLSEKETLTEFQEQDSHVKIWENDILGKGRAHLEMLRQKRVWCV